MLDPELWLELFIPGAVAVAVVVPIGIGIWIYCKVRGDCE